MSHQGSTFAWCHRAHIRQPASSLQIIKPLTSPLYRHVTTRRTTDKAARYISKKGGKLGLWGQRGHHNVLYTGRYDFRCMTHKRLWQPVLHHDRARCFCKLGAGVSHWLTFAHAWLYSQDPHHLSCRQHCAPGHVHRHSLPPGHI